MKTMFLVIQIDGGFFYDDPETTTNVAIAPTIEMAEAFVANRKAKYTSLEYGPIFEIEEIPLVSELI